MSDLRLIFNSDDYGRTPGINEAVTRAHAEGLLTSASLMVTGDAWKDAVTRARAHPGLAVGLHLSLAGATAALSPECAPHLLDPHGRLPAGPAAMGGSCFFNPAVRAEVRQEIEAQIKRFMDTGLTPSHVDGHYLLHMHPTVLAALIPMAEAYGFRGIRVPRDDLRLALSLDRRHIGTKAGWAAIYALLCRLAERRLAQSSLAFTDRVYGLYQSGAMGETFVAGLVRRIPEGVRSAELYFHPSTQGESEVYGPNPGDLAALLSPRVRQAVDDRGARLTNYTALAASGHRRVACPGHCSS